MNLNWSAAIGSVAYILCCVFALRRGERAERVVATAMLLDYSATLLLEDYGHLGSVQYGILAGDVLVLGAVLHSTFTTNRKWTIAAASFQLLGVLIHVAKMMDTTVDGWSYLTAGVIVGYGLMLSLAVGTLLEARPGRQLLHTGET